MLKKIGLNQAQPLDFTGFLLTCPYYNTGIVNVLTGTYRGFARHDLTDEFLLVFNELPTVRIECAFRHIPKNLNLWIEVALT